jgi:hypothetical protein
VGFDAGEPPLEVAVLDGEAVALAGVYANETTSSGAVDVFPIPAFIPT